MGSLAEKVGTPSQERLGGARADFVAMLGRRIADLATTLKGLEVDPASVRLRDDMRRKLHALAAGAKLLRFTRLADEATHGERVLEAAAQRMTPLTGDEIIDLKALLECAPALAWGQASVDPTPTPTGVTTKAPESGRAPAAPAPTMIEPTADPETVLVVGPPALADALTQGIGEPLDSSAPRFEAERTDDCATAIDLARALAPDMVIIDVDRPGAKELVTALLSDPLTEPVPVVVVGEFAKPEDAAPFVALGVARALSKPVSPRALHGATSEVLATYVRREVKRKPLGELTLDDLGARLSEELYRGLCDAADKGRGASFDLGEGNEVLAALWGAVARIRDLVTIQSKGDVRFSPTGPEGALPLAPFGGTEGEPRAVEGRATSTSRAAAPSLKGKTIVVADDDPAVIWFLAGVLRAAGADVHEAHDGARALELCLQHAPDLVISDVLMPRLDGFSLCRALKRDLVLRDVPTILLSWKEDLLQRVRELGADADGYLRKEAAASTIIQRARELLRGRHRVAERLAAGGEVRGRLDGLTARTLLRLSCEARPNATVSIRDASFLYEVEVRNGRPVRATRTSTDGTFVRGPSVLGQMLGIGAGRFVVAPTASTTEGRTELDGTLDEQLLGHVASARAAQRLLSGTSLVHVEQVDLDPSRMEAYLAATPEPARSILHKLAAGASPRAMIANGDVAPRLLEDVLCDAAAHGAVSGVTGEGDEELLFASIERELRVMRGIRPPPAPLPEPVLDLGPVMATAAPGPVEPVPSELPPIAREESPEPAVSIVHIADRASVEPAAPAPIVLEPRVVAVVAPPPRAPEPPIAPMHAPIAVEPRVEIVAQRAPEPQRPTLGSLTPPPVAPPPKSAKRAPVREEPEPSPSPMPALPSKRPSSYVPTPTVESKPPKKDTSNRTMWMLFAVAGIVFAVGARLARDRNDGSSPASVATTQPAAQADTAAPIATSEPVASEPRADGESKSDPILPQDVALKDTDKVPPGQGLLEVVSGSSDQVWIDGTAVGNGPLVRRALAPRREPYEVRVKLRGEERVRYVLVKEGRLSRLRVAAPWSR